jgi:hypothetical protein
VLFLSLRVSFCVSAVHSIYVGGRRQVSIRGPPSPLFRACNTQRKLKMCPVFGSFTNLPSSTAFALVYRTIACTRFQKTRKRMFTVATWSSRAGHYAGAHMDPEYCAVPLRPRFKYTMYQQYWLVLVLPVIQVALCCHRSGSSKHYLQKRCSGKFEYY